MCEIQQQKITFVNVLFHLDLTLQLLRAIRVSGKSKEKSESTKKVREKFGRKGKRMGKRLFIHRKMINFASKKKNILWINKYLTASKRRFP